MLINVVQSHSFYFYLFLKEFTLAAWSLSCGTGSFVVVLSLFLAAHSFLQLCREGSRVPRLRSCGVQAQLPCSMWDLFPDQGLNLSFKH